MAFAAIGAIRSGEYNDEISVYGGGSSDASVPYVQADPKYVNCQQLDRSRIFTAGS